MKFPRIKIVFSILFCIYSLVLLAAENHEKFSGWKKAETKHYRFIYEDTTRLQAEGFARYADQIWADIAKIYAIPQEKTDVLITGRTDTVNASAEMINFSMNFYTNPPLEPEFGYREDWQKLFFTHEMIHIANMNYEGKSYLPGKIFGPLWNAFDFLSYPGWALEGLTTVLETELTDGGRGRSPFFELYYKALTVENAFLTFEEIGKETRPPKGQIYIMGYILMRSIADRWGLDTLSDIERNRTTDFNLLKSVELVTGESADVIFSDARISLAKKYTRERSIPEGKIITPHSVNDYYVKPALIKEDNSIVTIRRTSKKDAAAVIYYPGAKNETLLFAGEFSNIDDLAASDDGTIVASLAKTHYDKNPTMQVSTDLYKWTQDSGLVPLTNGTSLFEPVLSKDGSRLVAVELSGRTYRIVQVDLVTGEVSVLIELPDVSCIQPTLTSDGSYISFLLLDGKRAKLCVADLRDIAKSNSVPSSKTITSVNQISIVWNDSDEIIDIAYPHWSRNDKLSFASNERGRLEVWEFSESAQELCKTASETDNSFDSSVSYIARPVVSDPVGAFWAEETSSGVVYASYASSGNVLKIKPLQTWGDVPDFAGPSMPGTIATFGEFASDYPEFKPYENSDDNKHGTLELKGDLKKSREIIKRSQESRDKAAESDVDSKLTFETALTKEKRFINTPKFLAWLPTISSISYEEQGITTSKWGFGLAGVWRSYALQDGADTYFLAANASYYPELNQVSGDFMSLFTLGTVSVFTEVGHDVTTHPEEQGMSDSFKGIISFSIPISSWSFYNNYLDTAIIAGIKGETGRNSLSSFSINSDLPFTPTLCGIVGLDIAGRRLIKEDLLLSASGYGNVLFSYYPTLNDWTDRVFVLGEGAASCGIGVNEIQLSLGAKGRWFDLPKDTIIPSSLVNLRAGSLTCEYPGRLIMESSVVIPGETSLSVFVEKLVSFGTNSFDYETTDNHNSMNAILDPVWYTGFEGKVSFMRGCLAAGIVYGMSDFDSFDASKLSAYVSVKMDAVRGILR